MSNMLRLMVSVSDAGAGLDTARTSFPSAKWRICICLIHKIYPRFASKKPVNITAKVMLFVQLGDLGMHAHFWVDDNLSVLLLIATSFIDWFGKEILHNEQFMIPIRSRPVAIISEYTPCREHWLYYRAARKQRPLLMTDR